MTQLLRLAQVDSERVETMLNTLWNSYPGLLGELAIAAVDQEQLSVDKCAEILKISTDEVDRRLLEFRKRTIKEDYDWAVVVDRDSSIAKLAESSVAVWEIVREYRKLGSVERLTETFPSLPKSELAAALVYAEQHPAEIEDQISKYESILRKKRSEYPFMK
ncbi:MAG: hypothetical protein BGO01_18560 [Armatimonadetes bacterium 55-13]|nr:MAG: hypothetical protein BGO01_18560 [Armatimonadetes bacterium 55-13]